MRSRGAFTLVQVVTTSAVVILAVAGISQFSVRTCTTTNQDSARTQLLLLEDATDLYKLGVGNCPTMDQGLAALIKRPDDLADPARWQGPYLEKASIPLDPWNHEYRYEVLDGPRGVFRIWSVGPDGLSRTDDDIVNTEP